MKAYEEYMKFWGVSPHETVPIHRTKPWKARCEY